MTTLPVPSLASHPERRKFPQLRDFLDHGAFGISLVFLILLSVGLILYETFGGINPEIHNELQIANDVLTGIFITELFLRWLVTSTTRRFFATYWIDILAVLPMLRIFRLGRIFALARIFRIFSLGTIMHRRISVFGNVLGSQIMEYMLIFGIMLFALVFGAVGLAEFEVGADLSLKSHSEAFWMSLFSLLSGQYATYPTSLGGKVVFFFLSIFAMGIFAMLTGTISAVMIEKLKENAMKRYGRHGSVP